MPDALLADVLQSGWVCAALPPQPRLRLLPPRGDGLLRSVALGDDGRWHVQAVDLAAQTATVEVDLGARPPLGVWPLQAGWLVLEPLDLPAAATPSGRLRWVRSEATLELAEGATQVVSAATDGERWWYVTLAGDATPLAWEQTATTAPPRPLGPARWLWAVVNDGKLLVVRGDGADGPETQILEPASGSRWRIGPDGTGLAAVGPGLAVQTHDGRLVGLDEWPGVEVSLPGAVTGDRLLEAGGQAAVVRLHADSRQATLLWFDGRALLPVVTLGPSRWLGAEPRKGGIVAALLGATQAAAHPPDTLHAPTQLCLVALAVHPLTVDAVPADATPSDR
jgi:hypothetical protein